MTVVIVKGSKYAIHKNILKVWDGIKGGALKKKDEDRVYVVDGPERVGKSVWTLQQAAYIDPTIVEGDLDRICFTVEETMDAIKKFNSTNNETKVIIFDEAFRGLSSKSALSKDNKKLVQLMMEMGQKNLVLFLVSPSFYLLELYPAVFRSECLFHVFKRKDGRRAVRYFNRKKKAILYTQHGMRKGWSYNIPSKRSIPFPPVYPGGDEVEKKYRAKKLKSIKEFTTQDPGKEEENRFKQQRDRILWILRHNRKMSYKKISEELKARGTVMDKTSIAQIVREVERKTREKKEKNGEMI